MDRENRNDVSAVFGVEVIEVRGVLEVVGQDGAVLYNIIGDNIVAVLLDIQGDVLRGQNFLGNSQDLSVGSGGSGNGDGLTGQSGVIEVGIIAIAGVFYNGDNGTIILFGDVIGNLLAGEGGDEGLDEGFIFIAFLYRQDIGIGGGGAFQCQGILGGIEAGGDGVVGIDDSIVNIGQQVGQLGSLDFAELNVLGVFYDIQDGGGDADTVLQLDVALILQQQQRACFIGGIIRNGDLELGFGRRRPKAAAGKRRAERPEQLSKSFSW